MATDNFENEATTTEPKRKGSGCLKGCLIAVGLAILLAALAGWWVSRNWRGMVSSGASQAINQMVDQADLPAQEKQELKDQAARITDGVADGSISLEQLGKLMDGIAKSPLMPLIIVKSAEAQYLNNSGLSDEEKEAGRTTLRRYARGLADDKFSPETNDKLMSHIADKDAEGNWEPREQISDDDLRAFLADAKQAADDAGIPEEVEPIDPSDELKKVIDSVIGPAAALPAE